MKIKEIEKLIDGWQTKMVLAENPNERLRAEKEMEKLKKILEEVQFSKKTKSKPQIDEAEKDIENKIHSEDSAKIKTQSFNINNNSTVEKQINANNINTINL